MSTILRSVIAAIVVSGAFTNAYADGKGKFDNKKICKAGIAKIMARDPQIIGIDYLKGGAIYLSYTRKDDNTNWGYKCKVEGNKIIWGADDGRWRTHPMDSKVTYKVKGNSITVTDSFSGGSSSNKTYTLNQFSK